MAPTLVLLHGFADSADTWRPLLDRLRKLGRAAVALDMPGFGQAGYLDPEQPVLPQLDAFADAAAEHWSAESGGRVVLAGNSLGGTAALRAAERDGELIAGVAPIAPAGLEMPTWFAAIQGAPLVKAMLSSPVPVPEGVEARNGRISGDGSTVVYDDAPYDEGSVTSSVWSVTLADGVPAATVEVLPPNGSDHRPVSLTIGSA